MLRRLVRGTKHRVRSSPSDAISEALSTRESKVGGAMHAGIDCIVAQAWYARRVGHAIGVLALGERLFDRRQQQAQGHRLDGRFDEAARSVEAPGLLRHSMDEQRGNTGNLGRLNSPAYGIAQQRRSDAGLLVAPMNRQTTENQHSELKRFVLQRRWQHTQFVDAGVSGAKASRPP